MPSSPTNENNNAEDIQNVSSPESSQPKFRNFGINCKKGAKKGYKGIVTKTRSFTNEATDCLSTKPKLKNKAPLVKDSQCPGLSGWLGDDLNAGGEGDSPDANKKMTRYREILASSSFKKVVRKFTSSSNDDDDDAAVGSMKKKTKLEDIDNHNVESDQNSMPHINDEYNSANEDGSKLLVENKKWINVTVGDKSLGVPMGERNRQLSVSWLAEETSSRYYAAFGRKPVLCLSVKGMILMPDDPMEGLFIDEEQVTASIIEWIDIPIETRFEDACRNFSSSVHSSLKKDMVECEQSGFLDLSCKSLQLSQLRPLCHIMQNLTFLTQLNLGGNKLGNEGLHAFIDVFKFLPYLTLIDLSSNLITFESIYELLNHLKSFVSLEKKSLQSLKVLLLANNHLTDLSSSHLFNCLDHLPLLKHLDVSSCGLTDKFFDETGSAVKFFRGDLLSYLDLSGNNDFKKLHPKVLLNCLNFARLQTLRLPQVQCGFMEILRRHLEGIDGEVDFRFLSICGINSFNL